MDLGLYTLALKLGMTVGRLKREMSMREFLTWELYFRTLNKGGGPAAAPVLDLATATPEQLRGMF